MLSNSDIARAQVTHLEPGRKGTIPNPSTLPYKEVAQFKSDKRLINVFISFDCPYSYLYDSILWRWGRDLPDGWHLQFSPILTTDQSSFNALKMFYAVKIADRNKLEMFMNKTYSAIQTEKRNPMEEKTWTDIVKSCGVDWNKFITAWGNLDNSEQLVAPSVARADHYVLEVTPSIAIDGRYVISPDNTNGDPELFIQLLNGMVSKAAGYA